MAWNEKPPILTGKSRDDLQNLRDYLFRMASSLEEIAVGSSSSVTVSHSKDGTQVLKPGAKDGAIDAVRRNAEELRSLIIKSADNLQQQIVNGDEAVIAYTDSKREEYDGRYLATSAFGTFEENLNARIATTARGVVENYDYTATVQGVVGDSISLLQGYYEAINGEIRRGLVLDPDTNTYVIGIVISQAVTFSGVVGDTDPNNPHDGNVYYYVAPDQTFGIYTATGWQFWINGTKRGWFSSLDSMLHVSNIIVENKLQAGEHWEISFTDGFGIKYTGV